MSIPPYYRFVLRILTRCRWLVGPTTAVALWLLPLLALAGGPGWQPGFNTPGLNGLVYRVVQWQGNSFIAGGDFTDAGGQPGADHVARWDGRRWRALGTGPGFSGPGSYLSDLLVLPNGDLVAAGGQDDTTARTCFVTRWDGKRWQRLGARFNNHRPDALAAGTGGELLLAVNSSDRAVPSGLHRWNGTAWQPLEPLVAVGEQPSAIGHLVVLPAGDIMATGYLRGADGVVFQGVGRWTGTAWEPRGPALPEPYRYHLLVAPDGAFLLHGPPLTSTSAGGGGTAGGLLRWDGRAWQPGPAPPTGAASALVLTRNGEVLAPGRFTRPGDTLTYGYARYDGTRWQVLPLPRRELRADPSIVAASVRGELLVNGAYGDLRCWDGRVYIGGAFEDAGGHPRADYVARWDGNAWQALGAGLNQEVHALVIAPNGTVIVGGDFTATGDEALPMFHWGMYREP